MKIISTEHAVPSRRVTNEEIHEMIVRANGHLDDHARAAVRERVVSLWKQSGTMTRRIRADGETALPFALDAGRTALASAGMAAEEVDVLIYVGVARGWLEPATAHVIQHELGLVNATSFDVLDACASWMRGVQVALALLRSGAQRTAMIVNCEFNCREFGNFRLRGPEDLDELFATFTIGEAATATILSADDEADDFQLVLDTYGGYFNRCMIPLAHADEFSGDTAIPDRPAMTFFSNSRELIAFTSRKIVETYQSHAAFRNSNPDIVFGHAVSERVGRMLCDQLGIPACRYYPTYGEFGNTVSAALPLAISLAAKEGRLRRGMKTLLVAGSAGVTVGLASFTF